MKNDKYKIVALFGEAGAGKNYLLDHMMKIIWGKIHLHRIISCTSRPPREGELDGVDYHFFKTSVELAQQHLIEYSIFKNWWYGTVEESLNPNKINIGIFNINSINQLLNGNSSSKIDCLPIRILCADKIRLIRQLEREASPNCLEICRRFQSDKEDFSKIPFEYKGVYNNIDETQYVINEIFDIIKDWTKKEK